MTIKTLKNIEPKRDFPNSGDSGYFEGFFEGVDKTKSELKAEAVKWVKHIKELGLNEMLWCEFFNLTEEDLK